MWKKTGKVGEFDDSWSVATPSRNWNDSYDSAFHRSQKLNIQCYCWLANISSNVYLPPRNRLFTKMWTWRQNYITSSNEHLIFMSVQYLQFLRNTLKIFFINLNIFHVDINENVSGWFFSEHSVWYSDVYSVQIDTQPEPAHVNNV